MPKSLKSCPKCKKSPNLVTLLTTLYLYSRRVTQTYLIGVVQTIPSIFFFTFICSTLYSKLMFDKNDNVWIRTQVLWCQGRLFCQLCHNLFPTSYFLVYWNLIWCFTYVCWLICLTFVKVENSNRFLSSVLPLEYVLNTLNIRPRWEVFMASCCTQFRKIWTLAVLDQRQANALVFGLWFCVRQTDGAKMWFFWHKITYLGCYLASNSKLSWFQSRNEWPNKLTSVDQFQCDQMMD